MHDAQRCCERQTLMCGNNYWHGDDDYQMMLMQFDGVLLTYHLYAASFNSSVRVRERLFIHLTVPFYYRHFIGTKFNGINNNDNNK